MSGYHFGCLRHDRCLAAARLPVQDQWLLLVSTEVGIYLGQDLLTTVEHLTPLVGHTGVLKHLG